MSIVPEVVPLPSAPPTGKWCLAWWCFGGAGQSAVMTWCCPPSSSFYCTASGESLYWLCIYIVMCTCILTISGFLHEEIYLLTLWFHTQVGGFVRGSVRPPVRLRAVVFCDAGGPWPRVPGHPGQLPYLWERHHVAEYERQHSVHTAQGSCAVRHLYTAR